MAKILLTAFKPYGLIRGLFLQRNSSKEVLELIKKRNRFHDVNYEVLPVDKGAEKRLDFILKREPTKGVVCLGELLVQPGRHIHIEPYAVTSVGNNFGLHKTVESEFAKYAIDHFNQSPESKIGTYYCNKVYLRALKWSEDRAKCPVVFAHIPVAGDRNKHSNDVIKLLNLMRQWISV
jgi:pyrrolidone-carboxylate peptidase